MAIALRGMAQTEAAGHLRQAQTALIEAMDTGDLGELESEIDMMQEKLEDYAIDLDPEYQSSA